MANMKRRLAAVAVGLTALMALSSCSGGNAPAASNQASTDNAATTAAAASADTGTAALAPYEINWYMVANGQPPGTDAVMAKVNELLKPINATLNFHVVSWADWDTKIGAMISSSDYFDIVFTANWSNYMTKVKQGAIIPVDDLMQQYGQNIISDCGQTLLDTCKVDGKLYAVPTNKDNFCAFGYVFNQSLLDKYNLDIDTIKTWSDITPWLDIIKKNEPGIIPMAAGGGSAQCMLDFDTADVSGTNNVPLGMYFDNRDNQIHYYLDDPGVQQIFDMWRQWFQAGYIPSDAALANSTTVTDAQTEGTCFSWVVQLKPGKAGELSNAKVTYTQKLMTDYYLQSGMGSMQAISTTSKDPARCMMFLNMLYGPDHDLLNLLTWGIEGTDYNLAADGRVQPVTDPGWNLNMQWGFGNQLNELVSTTQPADEYVQMAEVNKNCKQMYCSGFIFDPTNVTTQWAAVQNAVKPLLDPVSCGAVDPATTLPQIKTAATAAGIDDIKAELEKQMQAHMAANPLK